LLDQLSVDYNAAQTTHNASHPFVYSWDATNPKTGAIGDLISTKSGCAKIARPNGSSAGIATLASNIKDPKGGFCEDFARSSRARKATDPPAAKGGVLFVALAKDAVTYASLAKGSNAPKNLTTSDLTKIYSCSVSTWNQVGGTSHAKIDPVLPQSSSGTYAFFLAAIGVTTPGKCVTSSTTLEENEGINPVFKGNKNAIVPFSIGKWLTQEYRSAKCSTAACITCKPKKGQNDFGCAVNGVLGLNSINGTKPTVGVGSKQTINTHFSATFIRTLYDVVRYSTSTKDHIPANLERFFASSHAKVKGWFCATSKARADLSKYGYLPTPLCGLGS
jgi:hypothetical protein